MDVSCAETQKTVKGVLHAVAGHTVSRLQEPAGVFLALVPQRVEFGGDDEGIRLVGKILRQKRGEIRVRKVAVVPLIEVDIFADTPGGQQIIAPVSATEGKGEFSLWSG